MAPSAEEEPEELGALSGLLDAEVLFRIGLNQVEPDNLYLQAALHTNLGITLMKQGKAAGDPDVDPKRLFEEAGEHFQSAIEIEIQQGCVLSLFYFSHLPVCGGHSAVPFWRMQDAPCRCERDVSEATAR